MNYFTEHVLRIWDIFSCRYFGCTIRLLVWRTFSISVYINLAMGEIFSWIRSCFYERKPLIEFLRHTFEKYSYITLYENPSSESRVVQRGHKDRHDGNNFARELKFDVHNHKAWWRFEVESNDAASEIPYRPN
jgi:hypothetical protein